MQSETGRHSPRSHAAVSYLDDFVSELRRLINTAALEGSDLQEELGSPQDAARHVYEILPRRSPWAKVIGPVYSTAQVTMLLRGSRQAVNDRVRRRTLLALRTADEHLVYPTFQFEGAKVLPGLADVLQAVGDVVDPWTLASWLVAPQPELGGSVIETLARQGAATPEVMAAATAAVRRWSH